MKRGAWGTRFGLYMAAIGSACGLGNLWRFPYVVGENGGGAFILLYVLLALALGLPLLIGELMLGKATRKSVLTATKELIGASPTLTRWVGRLSVILSLVVLSYYAVISGWVLHFLTRFGFGLFSAESIPPGTFQILMENGWLQVALASVHLILAVVVVARGVQEGLEKWVGYIIPIFVLLLIVLVARSLSLPSGPTALRFLFYPDFSALTYSSVLMALGHVLFTLSVGFGTMVTFGSYMREGDHVPTAGVRVATVDSVISILACLLLFPIVLSAANIRLKDPALLFEALPHFLLGMPGGEVFGIAFFICLYFAALGASIGLLEVIVSNMVDLLKWRRDVSAWIAGGAALSVALIPALSSTVFHNIRVGERGVLEIFDMVLINWTLPLLALGLTVVISRGMAESTKKEQFIDTNKYVSVSLYSDWNLMLRYVIPVIIIGAFALEIFGRLFG